MTLYNKIRVFVKTLFLIVVSLSVSSCVADRGADEPGGRRTDEVRIGAYIEDVAETRTQGATTIWSGTYYMAYPNPNPDNANHSVCEVNFYDGIGVTTTYNKKELKWEEVGSLTYNDVLTNFFLDNVAPPEGVDQNETEIKFTDTYHPFDAAEYAGDGGYNDLLWGYAFVDLYTTADINIGIHHYLSRVSVIVTVDNSLENAQAIDFKNGSVKITNVVKKANSYTRTNGSISLGDNPYYEDLELAKGDWASISYDETNSKISYYQTKNFVIPPQALRTDELRPRLVLDVPQPDGTSRTYSGVIPRVMMVDGSPATMAFDPEKNLTLKVKISQDQLRIESIVAYVQDWVDKGSFLVSAYNGYISSIEDLQNLIEIYPEQNEDAIRAYGFHHTYDEEDRWSFNILADLEIKVDEVAGKMGSTPDKPLPDFSFDITSHNFTLVYPDGTKKFYDNAAKEAAKVLHDLLRNGIVPKLNENNDDYE